MNVTRKIGTLLLLMTVGSLIGVMSIAVFLSGTSRDAVLLIAGMMEMNLAQRIHVQSLRVQSGHPDAVRELEELVAAFDVFVDLGRTEGPLAPPVRSIDETLTQLVLLSERDVERIQQAARLIREGLPTLPPDLQQELDAVGREWAEVRPDLVLLTQPGLDDPSAAESLDRIDTRIGELVRALEVLQGAVGVRLQLQRGRLLSVMGSIALTSLALFGFGLWTTHRYIARPIRSLDEAARRVRGGEFSQRVPIIAGGELASLAGSFNGMLEELEHLLDDAESSEKRYRELFDNANDLVCIADLTGRFTSINKAAESISGYTRDEALGMRLQDLVAPEYVEVVERMMARKLEGDTQTVYEVEIISKDGERVPLELSPRLTFDNGKPVGVEGIGRDISERRHLQEQLWLAQKMDVVGRLAGGIAHDFGNVLTIVTGYCALLLGVMPEGDPAREQVEGIKRAADRGASLTNQILSFSRGQFVQPRMLSLNAVVAEQAEMLWRILGENVELATVLNPTVGLVHFDPGQLEQVIMNLALNSRDAMPGGGRLTLATSRVDLDESDPANPGSEAGSYVALEVRDTGEGMKAETIERMFEPFFTTKAKGTGLGLSTVYGIVRENGGRIKVESEPGQGTRIRICLPRAGDVEQPEPVPADPEELTVGPSETVLLVEDEETVRRLVGGMIRALGYEVIEARDENDAVEISEGTEHIDILVTDVVMPNLNGPQLAHQIRLNRPDIKVLFISGYTGGALNYHVRDRQDVHLLQKPFTPESMAAKMREVLDN